MKKVTSILFLMLNLAMANVVFSQKPAVVGDKPGWHKIGEVKADFTTEVESIVVLGDDEFESVKLAVADAPIDINKVTVYYESGEEEEIPVKGKLQPGSETEVFDLKYPARELKKVSFTYRCEPNYKGNKAHVVLYGLK
jgi:hypothetical protein